MERTQATTLAKKLTPPTLRGDDGKGQECARNSDEGAAEPLEHEAGAVEDGDGGNFGGDHEERVLGGGTERRGLDGNVHIRRLVDEGQEPLETRHTAYLGGAQCWCSRIEQCKGGR